MSRKPKPDYSDRPTQKTPKTGETIPLPKRSEIMGALEKLAKPTKRA